jgi:phage terminase small subunit
MTVNAVKSAKALTTKERAFVEAYVEFDGNREQAITEAGYNTTYPRQLAVELLRKPHIIQALLEETGLKLVSSAPKALATLQRLMDAKSDYVALEAARDVLDRSGFKSTEKHDHRITGDVSIQIDLS